MDESNFRSVYEYATTKDEAQAAAKAKADRVKRAQKTFSFSMPGTLDYIAGAFVTPQGFRQGVSGRFKVVKVQHSISRSGWTTSVEAESS